MEFLEENENEIIRNIKLPELFIEDSFEVVNLPMNVKAIVGKLKDPNLSEALINPDKKCVQGVKFLKPDWDVGQALEWLKENIRYFEKGEIDKKIYAKELKSIDGVEIFSAGTWNGDKYTTKDLDEMVKAFEENETTVRPFLKLGHSDKQKLLESEGLPAAGWVGRIYRSGDKLLADFIDIPKKIYELIENKAYRKVSSEIYLNVKIKEKAYKYMVGAVALLGAETPGVMNLSDILARFGLKHYDSIKNYAEEFNKDNIKTYFINDNITQKGENMSTEENKELLKKLEEVEAKLEEAEKKYSTELEAKTEELKTISEAKDAAEKKIFEAEEKAKEAEMEKQVEGLVNEKVISKSMKPFAMALLKNEVDAETKKYSFKSEEDKEVSLDRYELIKEFASLAKATSDVNFEENSEEGKKEKEAELDAIEKFAKENDLSYGEAYRQYNAGKLKVEKPHVTEE